jgi:hypothetical protein
MNYKMQLSPISVTHSGVQPSTLSRDDAKFFRSWLVYDSDLETARSHGLLNWTMLASLAFIALVSLSGWFGIAVLVRSFLK